MNRGSFQPPEDKPSPLMVGIVYITILLIVIAVWIAIAAGAASLVIWLMT